MSPSIQTAVFALAAALAVVCLGAILVDASEGELAGAMALTVLPRSIVAVLGCVLLTVAATKLTIRCFRGGGFDLYWPWLLLVLVGTLLLAPDWGATLGLAAIVLVFVARREW